MMPVVPYVLTKNVEHNRHTATAARNHVERYSGKGLRYN